MNPPQKLQFENTISISLLWKFLECLSAHYLNENDDIIKPGKKSILKLHNSLSVNA